MGEVLRAVSGARGQSACEEMSGVWGVPGGSPAVGPPVEPSASPARSRGFYREEPGLRQR